MDTSYLAAKSENSDTLTLTIRKTNYDLLNEFVKLRCAQDLLALNVFQNAANPVKEITEAMGLFKLIRKVLGDDVLMDAQNRAWCVGDGTRPRMGAMLAYRTKWQVNSVDPIISFQQVATRLFCLPLTVEELVGGVYTEIPGRILVACHSHAPMGVAVKAIRPEWIFTLPCCVNQHPGPNYKLIKSYHDWGILSPHREVFAWQLTK